MKVFEFIDGKIDPKNHLSFTRQAKCCFGGRTSTGQFTFSNERVLGSRSSVTLHTGASYAPDGKPSPNLYPEYYGVEATAFCTGPIIVDGRDEWQWHVIATPKKVEEWVSTGFVLYTQPCIVSLDNSPVDLTVDDLIDRLAMENPCIDMKRKQGHLTDIQFLVLALSRNGHTLSEGSQGISSRKPFYRELLNIRTRE